MTLPKHDLTGRVFGKLTVISFAGMKQYPKQRHATWNCQCECGNTSVVMAANLGVPVRLRELCGGLVSQDYVATSENVSGLPVIFA